MSDYPDYVCTWHCLVQAQHCNYTEPPKSAVLYELNSAAGQTAINRSEDRKDKVLRFMPLSDGTYDSMPCISLDYVA